MSQSPMVQDEKIRTNHLDSRISYVLSSLYIVFMTIVLFRPSPMEFVTIFLIDFAINVFLFTFVDKLYLKIYPIYKGIFPVFDKNADDLENYSTSKKLTLAHGIFKMPTRRACFVSFFTIIKSLAIGTVIVHFWDHKQSFSVGFLWSQFVLMIFVFNVSFFIGVFFEGHRICSKLLNQLGQKANWSSIILKVSTRQQKQKFEYMEFASFLALVLVFVIRQFQVFFYGEFVTDHDFFFLTVWALVVAARHMYVYRELVKNGLSRVAKNLDKINSREKLKLLTPYTLSSLNLIDNSYNALVVRLNEKEEETSALIQYELEHNKYTSLGEIAGLVAHDLATPLHTILYCIGEIKDDPKKACTDERLVFRLDASASRIHELVNSLRSYLRETNGSLKDVKFIEIHKKVIEILKIEFFNKNFSSIDFVLDEDVEKVDLVISDITLNHILYNLYKNAVKNLLENDVSGPQIRIQVKEKENKDKVISISDNGTGLKNEVFEKMTNYTFNDYSSLKKSLGLKLTRRLIEGVGGRMYLDKDSAFGTKFNIHIPYMTKQLKEDLCIATN